MIALCLGWQPAAAIELTTRANRCPNLGRSTGWAHVIPQFPGRRALSASLQRWRGWPRPRVHLDALCRCRSFSTLLRS